MAHLDMKVTYHLELTPEEFRIVGRALACILKPGDETKAASELNARLQELRLKQGAAYLRAMQGDGGQGTGGGAVTFGNHFLKVVTDQGRRIHPSTYLSPWAGRSVCPVRPYTSEAEGRTT